MLFDTTVIVQLMVFIVVALYASVCVPAKAPQAFKPALISLHWLYVCYRDRYHMVCNVWHEAAAMTGQGLLQDWQCWHAR